MLKLFELAAYNLKIFAFSSFELLILLYLSILLGVPV